MTILMTIFIGLPIFLLSVIAGRGFTTALKRLTLIAAFGILIDLSIVFIALCIAAA